MSNDFSVVKIGATQYKVKKGDKLQIDKIPYEKGKTIIFDDVLLTSKAGKILIGTPKVKDAIVKAKVLDTIKKKMKIQVYRAKSRYRRKKGHKQEYTMIEIAQI
jgi:large subunit ribosomal protein L21